MKSQCYLHGYPLECQNQLQDLFNLIREGDEFIQQIRNNYIILIVTLERIFKLLRVMRANILLHFRHGNMKYQFYCKLLRRANQACHQNAKNHLQEYKQNLSVNEMAFHQLVHNHDIQMIYKPKKDVIVNTPPTLDGLFRRLGEQIERKRLQEKVNDDSITNKEKFNFMLQLLQVGSPRNDRENSVVVEKVKSVRKFKDDEFKSLIKPQKTKRKAESMMEAPQISVQPKFTKLPNATLHLPTSRIRRLHDRMMQQMDELRMDPNVQKLSNIIHKSQGNLSIRLPQIQYI